MEGYLLPLLEKISFHTLLIELVAKAGKNNHLSVEQLLERLDSDLSHALVQDVMFEKLEANLKTCGDLINTLSAIMKSEAGFLLDSNKAWDYQEYAQAVAQKFQESDTNIGLLNFYLADFYKNIGNLEAALTSIQLVSKHF